MNTEKKIKIQQKIIENLNKENQRLKEQNTELETSLLIAKETPKAGYDKAKDTMCELEKRIKEYEILIQDTKSAKESYTEKKKQMEKLIIEYKQHMNKTVKSIKRCI